MTTSVRTGSDIGLTSPASRRAPRPVEAHFEDLLSLVSNRAQNEAIVLPIIRKELLGNGRKGRFFVLRAAYLVLLALVAIPMILALADEMGQQPKGHSFSSGLQYTLWFGWLQILFVVMLAPALSVTALTREKTSGVLELLFVSGVRPSDVVLGKLAARTLWLGLYVLSGVPLLLLAGTLLGGAGFETVALFSAHSLTAAILGSAVGILVSGAFRRALPALLGAYAAQFAMYGVPFLWALSVHNATGGVQHDLVYFLSGPAAIADATLGKIPSEVAWRALLPPLLLAAGFTIAGFGFVRPTVEKPRSATLGELGVALLEGSREGVRLARTQAERPSRLVTGNPVAWREARSHRYGFSSRALRLAYVGIGGAVAFHILVFSVIGELRGLARFGIGSLVLGASVVALVIATTSIASERESRALALLKLSQLSAAEILVGKILGLARFLWPAIALPMVPAVAFLALDNSAFVLTAVLVGVLFLSACAIGFFFSTVFRHASMALSAALGTTIAWLGLVPFAASWLPPDSRGPLLAFANPIVSVAAVVSGFASEPQSPWQSSHYRYRDPWDFSEFQWAGWAGIIGIAFVGALSFLIAGWRLEREEGDA